MVILKRIFATLVICCAGTTEVMASLHIFTCEPEWAALARELVDETVEVYSATTALQDPHQIQARPSLIAHARNADLMICSGAELETGWLPQVQRQAGNAKIQNNAAGYFETSSVVPRLEVPATVDRSQGDVHAAGNPHIQTNPHNIALVASALSVRLAQIDPLHATDYGVRNEDFQKRWQTALAHWEQALAPLRGKAVVTHHKYWVYLLAWLDLHEVATLEPKPGVPTNVAHLAEVLAIIEHQPVIAILRTPYDTPQPSTWLAERSRIPAVTLPGTVGGLPGTDDLFGLFEKTTEILAKLVNGASP
jgi:zinc/manganese transport system substrate-binding protein